MAAATDDVPLLVRVLAGNPATSAAILGCLNTVDATTLRQLNPAVAGVVAGVPWADMDTAVVDAVRWPAALPAAMGARVSDKPAGGRLAPPALAALAGVTHLDLRECEFVADELLLRLRPSVRTLNVSICYRLTQSASFAHLTELEVLDCRGTRVTYDGVAGLPASLRELDINGRLPAGASFAHLVQLRVLRADLCDIRNAALASLPPSLVELHIERDRYLTPMASFAHLGALRTLDISHTDIGDASLASLPPSLVLLRAQRCYLAGGTALPHLPALRLLDLCEATGIGDALMASLPAGLEELRMSYCRGVTAGATLDHLPALRMLHCIGAEGLAPATLAACRARGCAVSAAFPLRGHWRVVRSLAVLADGRLASGDVGGEVRLWDAAADGDAPVVLNASGGVYALAALPDGRLAAGAVTVAGGCIDVWDVATNNRATTRCAGSVLALAVLHDGRLAAGCKDSKVLVVDVANRAVEAVLEGHTGFVTALAVLPDGHLVSGSNSTKDLDLRVWDVDARVCVATLTGRTHPVCSLAVLADGRLAIGTDDGIVELWDVMLGTCTYMSALVARHTMVTALAALPDGRLVAGYGDGTIWLYDTRAAAVAAVAATSRAVGTMPVETLGLVLGGVIALKPLPDGRLACASVGHYSDVHLLEVPPPAVYP